MTNTKTRVWLALAFALTAVLAFFAGTMTRQDAPHIVPDKPAVEDAEVLYWRAPMDPNERYDEPGKSRWAWISFPSTMNHSADSSIVVIDPAALQRTNFRTERVAFEHLSPTIRTTGRLTMDERGFTSISLKVAGWIQKLHVNFDGAMVMQGTPLIELYSPDLVSTQNEYILALRNLDRATGDESRADAQRVVDAAERRLAYWDVSTEQIALLRETREPTSTMTFYAPHSGEVMHMNVVEGQYVEAGDRLLDVADISTIWLIADIHEEDLSRIGVGTEAMSKFVHGQASTSRVA